MYNDKPCDTCDHYDPVLKGARGKTVETVWGWCSKQSVYPFKEGPGQVFPPGVKRVSSPDTLATVKIVRKGQTVSNCKLYKARKVKLSKSDLVDKLKAQ